MYCLENAVSALQDENPWLLESVDFEALEGITDGSNRVFRTPHRPLDQASSITVYDQTGTEISSGSYTMISWDSGRLRFTQGISEQYYADYAVADPFYSTTKLKEICRSGFREMMRRWPQPWYLVDSGGSTFISGDQSALSDPAIGGLTFSTSDPVLKVFGLCCTYELQSSRWRKASSLDVDYREGMSGGVAVTTHYRAQALKDTVDHLAEEINTGLTTLEEELSGDGYGAFVSGAKSDSYEDVYEWWDDTDQAAST
jgi:hypothetical protein